MYVHGDIMSEVVFSWDEIKNQRNIAKHGLSFEIAHTAILHRWTIFALNDHPDGNRFEYLGYCADFSLVYVVTVESEYSVRIISARRATPRERRRYGKGI